jgi:WD40 repeat protein
LQYDYKLEEKHRKSIYCMSLNKSETFLVSSGGDKKIILWGKD